MKKLTYSDYMNGDVYIREEDEKVVLTCFQNEIEMTIDEIGRIYNEAGTYIADVKETCKI